MQTTLDSVSLERDDLAQRLQRGRRELEAQATLAEEKTAKHLEAARLKQACTWRPCIVYLSTHLFDNMRLRKQFTPKRSPTMCEMRKSAQ